MADKESPRGSAPSLDRQQAALDKLRQAFECHMRGMLPEAERLYLDALTESPELADALHLLGVLNAQRGDYQSAADLISRAIRFNPNDTNAHFNLGNVLRESNRFEEAIASYDRALVLAPNHIGVLLNRGLAFEHLRAFEGALASYDQAAAVDPTHAGVRYNRGNVLRDLGRLDDALASYDQALALDGGQVYALNNRANILMRLRRPGEALRDYDAAIAAGLGDANTHCNRGKALFELRLFDQALAAYERAIALDPVLAIAHQGRGNVSFELGRYDLAFRSYDAAYSIAPSLDYLEGCRLHTKMQLCDWRNLPEELAHLVSHVNQGKRATEPFWLLPTYASEAEQLLCARIFVADRHPPSPKPIWRGEKYDHRKIRVGYVSGEFRAQAVAYATADLFECHDRSKFEVHAFATGSNDGSPIRKRLEAAFDVFADVSGHSHREIADLIRAREIDILVNLNGHFGVDCTTVFAMRPSPIQVNYLGYPGTMGADYIDYLMADETVIPLDHRHHYSENIVYLPDCYQPTDRKRSIGVRTFTRSELGLPEKAFVFCCFNANHKLMPETFDMWMSILSRVEESVLWLGGSHPETRSNLKREAAARGVASDRIVFTEFMHNWSDHLARQCVADLFLDSLPHNAHTTAADALWQGVPVVTRLGSTFPGRVGASLLKALGLPELITHSAGDYEALALRLARDPALLAGIRAKLARNRITHPLFDTPRLARNIETAYRLMWERCQRDESPQSFAVEEERNAIS